VYKGVTIARSNIYFIVINIICPLVYLNQHLPLKKFTNKWLYNFLSKVSMQTLEPRINVLNPIVELRYLSQESPEKEPLSPEHRYVQCAELITKVDCKIKRHRVYKKMACLSSPKSELVIRSCELGFKSSRIGNAHGSKKQASVVDDTSHALTSSSAKNSINLLQEQKNATHSNFFMTIKLPHLKYQNQELQPARNKPSIETIYPKSNKIAKPTSSFNQPQGTIHPRGDVKDILTVTHNLQDMIKLIKLRAEDILVLEGLINVSDGSLRTPVQLVDDTILKVEYRENVRIALESNKISALSGIIVEEKELRKYLQ